MKGYWNGSDATFVGVTYEVTKPEELLWWQNMHIGATRQALMVTQQKSVWLIDNEHGDGYYKVTEGMGGFQCGHKSVINPKNVQHIPDFEINVVFDQEGLEAENEKHDQYIKVIDPEEYNRIQGIKRQLKDLYASPEYIRRSH